MFLNNFKLILMCCVLISAINCSPSNEIFADYVLNEESIDNNADDSENVLIEETTLSVQCPLIPEGTVESDVFADNVESFNPSEFASFKHNEMPGIVLGAPQGRSSASQDKYDVVSLGCDGEIVLKFAGQGIVNCEGPDFIVFENAFFINGTNKTFAEPAIVSVSQDGMDWYEFSCNIDENKQYEGCAGIYPVFTNSDNDLDPRDINVSGGDVFDLSKVGLNQASYVKIKDASSQMKSILGYDNGCGFTSSGFDLDTVVAIHGSLHVGNNDDDNEDDTEDKDPVPELEFGG